MMEHMDDDEDALPSIEDIRISARRLLQRDPLKESFQKKKRRMSRTSSSSFSYDDIIEHNTHNAFMMKDDDGQGIGYAMVICTIVGSIFSFIFPPITVLANIITMILGFAIICNCCCAKSYKLQSNTKRWAALTVFCTKLQSISIIIGYIIYFKVANSMIDQQQQQQNDSNNSKNDNIDDDEDDVIEQIINSSSMILIPVIISWIMNLFNIVFACLFTWEREGKVGCCSCRILFDNLLTKIEDKDALMLTA